MCMCVQVREGKDAVSLPRHSSSSAGQLFEDLEPINITLPSSQALPSWLPPVAGDSSTGDGDLGA